MKKLTADTEKIDIVSFNDQILKECMAMAKYALESGKRVPPDTVAAIQSFSSQANVKNVKNLVQIHEKLTRIIAPANPKTILLLETESAKNRHLKFLGLIPLVRQLMIVALISLAIFIFCQLFDFADTTLDVLDQSGLKFLFIILTLIASASLGAAFSSLFQANKYITAGTYDPKYETSYWIRFILGIIAGMTLSVLINLGNEGQANHIKMGRPLMAMLGGFSASLVYRIFTRLVDTVESLITGSKEESLSAKEKEMNARAMESDLQNRQEVAASLMNIVQQIDPQMDQQQIKDKLQSLINDVYLKSNSEETAANTSETETSNKPDQG